MKNRDLKNLKDSLLEIGSEPTYKGVEFAYFVIKNRKLIEGQLALLDEVIKDEDIVKYETERAELLQKHSTDEFGNIRTKRLSEDRVEYLILDENRETYLNDMKNLREKFSTTIKNYELKFEEYQKLLDKDVDSDIKFATIHKTKLPDSISIKHFDAIFDLVEFDF